MTQSELYTYARRLVGANSTDWTEANLVIDLNDALSDIWTRIKVARGVLEFDDTNYTDLPVATFPITTSTNRYKITEDDDSNQVITIHKVQLLDSQGKYVDIPRLKVGEGNQDALGSTETGFPTGYFEIGATISFDRTPTSATTGQVWFDRSPDFFAVGGTTFVPGIPHIYHKLIAEKAALVYAIIKNKNKAPNLQKLIELGEARIDEYESNRRDDEQARIEVAVIDPL